MASKKFNGSKQTSTHTLDDASSASASAAPRDPILIINSSTGLKLVSGGSPYDVIEQVTTSSVRAMDVSLDGNLLVHSLGAAFNVIQLNGDSKSGKKVTVKEPVHELLISPKNTYVATFTAFKSAPNGGPDEPNLLIHSVSDGSLVGSYISKKQSSWQPQWSKDESLFLRLNGTELNCYENGKFDRWVKKSENQKIASFSLVQNTRNNNHYVACYSSGTSAAPSTIKIYRYPNFASPMTSKSFFKADSVQIMWSPRGDCLLYLCISEVDKSGKSYYGEQKLNFMEANPSGTGYIVPVKKDGPIHNVAWLPGTTDVQKYIVISGFVPPKVSMFDVKGNLVFDFGGVEYSYNQIVVNPFGNLVALAGFGNMRGGVSVWEMDQKKCVAEFAPSDSTYISWSPDGQTLLTATTSPRLRVGNGFKLWKYNGTVLHDSPVAANETELYSVVWQPCPDVFSAPKITVSAKPIVIKPITAAKYVPPSIRNRETIKTTLKLEDQFVESHGRGQRFTSANKNRGRGNRGKNQQATQGNATEQASGQGKSEGGNTGGNAGGNSEAEKNIAKLTKKLFDIEKLKKAKDSGTVLLKEQLTKISREDQLRSELDKLKLSQNQ